MAYEATFSMSLGTSNTGIADLRAQLIDDAGVDVGSAVSSGFVEIDSGFYSWNYASLPDGHRGGVRFYSAASSGVTLSFAAINPEELEYTDSKTSKIWHTLTSGLTTASSIGKLLVDNINATISSRSSHTAADIWSSGARTLTSFGTLTTDTAAATWVYVTRTLTSGGGATVAEIWGALTSGITTSGSIGKLIIDKLNLITTPITQTAAGTADITITRAVTLDGLTITGITVPGGWLKCYFTVKSNIQDDLDEQSIVQIVVSSTPAGTDGLLFLNGATGTLADGVLIVGVDSVTVTLEDDATALLEDCQGLVFDVKFLIGSSKSTVSKQGTVDIALTATRTI